MVILTLLSWALIAPSAHAAFPGNNGKIAFTKTLGPNEEIFVMQPDGSGLVNLTQNPADDTDPTWSPDGQKIAFASYRDAPSFH